jgi:hypothetical protein
MPNKQGADSKGDLTVWGLQGNWMRDASPILHEQGAQSARLGRVWFGRHVVLVAALRRVNRANGGALLARG